VGVFLRYHPGAKEDLKAGVKIDYIFKKGFSVKKVSTPDIDVSDHLPVVAVLEQAFMLQLT
jgi:endonuclease/exonuclease/phosphatase (EEP) superfamily protein YafD